MKNLLSWLLSMSRLQVSGQWSVVRFTRAESVKGGWVLLGLPPELFSAACSRLFLLGAKFISAGCSCGHRSLWVVFTCPAGLSSRLACLFPSPAGRSPLFVSASGRVLSGGAERSVSSLSASALESRGVVVQSACQGGSSQLSLAS